MNETRDSSGLECPDQEQFNSHSDSEYAKISIAIARHARLLGGDAAEAVTACLEKLNCSDNMCLGHNYCKSYSHRWRQRRNSLGRGILRCLRDGIIRPPFHTLPTDEPLVPMPRTCGDGEYGDVPQALFMGPSSWDDQTAQSPPGSIGNRRSQQLTASPPPPSSLSKASIENESMKGASLSLRHHQSLPSEQAASISPSSSSNPDPATAAVAEDGSRDWLHWLHQEKAADAHQGYYPDDIQLYDFRMPQKDTNTNATAAKDSSPLSSPGFHQPKPGASSRYGQMLRENRDKAASHYLDLAKDSSLQASTGPAIRDQDIIANSRTDHSRAHTLPTKENMDEKAFSRHMESHETTSHVLSPTGKDDEDLEKTFKSYMELAEDTISSMKASSFAPANFRIPAADANRACDLLSTYRSSNTLKTSRSYFELAKDTRDSTIKGPADSQTSQENLDKEFHNFLELANGSMANMMKASSTTKSAQIHDANRRNSKDHITYYRLPNKDKTLPSYVDLDPRNIPPGSTMTDFDYRPLIDGNPGAAIMSFCDALRDGTRALAAAGV